MYSWRKMVAYAALLRPYTYYYDTTFRLSLAHHAYMKIDMPPIFWASRNELVVSFANGPNLL
jgi:hypothetical protein